MDESKLIGVCFDKKSKGFIIGEFLGLCHFENIHPGSIKWPFRPLYGLSYINENISKKTVRLGEGGTQANCTEIIIC
jgi:hypothetical protein